MTDALSLRRITAFTRHPAFRGITRNRGALVGMLWLLAVLLFITVVPVLSAHSPTATDPSNLFSYPTGTHLLGTDDLGRDTLVRLAVGGRWSLYLALTATAIAALFGTTLGVISGYTGAAPDFVIQRGNDVLLGLPSLVLALAVVSVVANRRVGLIAAAALVLLPQFIRFARGVSISVSVADHVSAARALGASQIRILGRHVLPDALGPLVVQISFGVGEALLVITGLGFLGLGMEPPQAEWGAMINAGRTYITTAPLLAFIPGLAIASVVLAANLVGDGLRDVLDPRER